MVLWANRIRKQRRVLSTIPAIVGKCVNLKDCPLVKVVWSKSKILSTQPVAIALQRTSRALAEHTNTKQDGSSFVFVCPRLRTQPQLSRYSITLLNCVAFVAFYNLFLYLCGFFLCAPTVSHLSHFDLTASHN